jgi:hypothetical protein
MTDPPEPRTWARWTNDRGRTDHPGDEHRRHTVDLIAHRLDCVDPDDEYTWLVDNREVRYGELQALALAQSTGWWDEATDIVLLEIEATEQRLQ